MLKKNKVRIKTQKQANYSNFPSNRLVDGRGQTQKHKHNILIVTCNVKSWFKIHTRDHTQQVKREQIVLYAVQNVRKHLV